MKHTTGKHMTENMSKAGAGAPVIEEGMIPPRQGEQYRCDRCGMEIQVTADCRCQDDAHMHFQCCGQELNKV